MRKTLLFLAFAAVSSLCMAQQGKLWIGDFRVGISGGADYILQDPHYNLGAQMVLRSSNRKLTPNVGLYIGLQKDLHKRIAWGLDENFNIGKGGWEAQFTNTKYSLNIDYDVTQMMFNERFGAHVAYFTGMSTQVQAGVGLYWNLYVSQQVEMEVTNATSAGYNLYGRTDNPDAMSLSYNGGVEFSLGVTYYVSNNWFLKGDVYYHLPLMNSGEYFVPGLDYDNELNDMVTALGDKKMAQISTLVTVGYLW